nr:NAD(P)H-dependent oxidoreductase subunit E [Candidatus Omnitrophota bacterium]
MGFPRITSAQDLDRIRKETLDEKERNALKPRILLCSGASCIASGALLFKQALQKKIQEEGMQVEIVETGCLGPCAQGPVIVVQPDQTFYQNLKPEDARDIVDEHLRKGRPVERLAPRDVKDRKSVLKQSEIDFFQKQVKIVLRNCGKIDPLKITDYIAQDGYQALAKALTTLEPDEVIEKVKTSGLRGRGGAGFLTGLKWELTRQAPG